MLEGFFAPNAIAVVGVARSEGKVGHFVFDNLLSAGFGGAVYPVNPRAEEIHGHRCYPDIASLPTVPDLAVIVVPAAAVAGVIDECGVAGVSSAVVISAGFKESGPAGGALERDVAERARAQGIRLLGPNCLGLIATGTNLNASFAGSMPPTGHIAFMSQSGALGTAILDWAASEGLGLSHFVSLGNRADLSEADLLDAWADDPDVKVIVAYLESVASGAAFLESASRVTRHKPVIALKSGGSDAGARAVSSHTGSLAGSESAYDSAFHRTGVMRARTVQELFDLATALSRQPLPEGQGVAILTNAGGPAVLATDACERAGVALASLENDTLESLRAALPDAAALYNPVDILGDAEPERYAVALEALYGDPNVRAVLVILTPQAMTNPSQTARLLVERAARSNVTTIASFMGGHSVAEARSILRDGDIPVYAFPEQAVATLSAMSSYSRHLERPDVVTPDFERDKDTVARLIAEARSRRHSFITEESASAIASAYGISVPRGKVARDLASARAFAREVGYPLVAKISSPDILHKSDIGGIVVGIESEEELATAYDTILGKARSYAPDAVIDGLHIQEMLIGKREVIVGVDRDMQFGPLVMFGLGGVYVEVLKDVTFRLAPLDHPEAREMISEIRGFRLLAGARGQKPADLDAISDVLVRVSLLVTDFPEIVELDINPLMVGNNGEGAVAADIRIGIGG